MSQSKEMPLKPERYWFNKNLFKCAECGKTLNIIEHNYCPQCGQKIDWSEYPTETEEEKPVLGTKPYYVAAWQRIGELAEAIERQYQSNKGDTELVQMCAAEIGWQCSIIESLNDVET